MNTLIVSLPRDLADPQALWDYVLTPDGRTVSEHTSTTLAQLPRLRASGDAVVALVPASQLSWHAVQLPAGSLSRRMFHDQAAPRLRAILEGLLEDHVLDDTDQLNFALAPQPRSDAPVWVAVCDRAWLRGAVQALAQSGHAVQRIVPEFSPGEPALLQVVSAPGAGEAQPPQLWALSAQGVAHWPMSSASVAALAWPADAPVLAEPALAERAEASLARPVALQTRAERQLLALQTGWNLAQFDFASTQHGRWLSHWREAVASGWNAPRWRPARLALLATLAVNLLGLNAWAWREQAQLQAQRAAIKGVLTQTFPQVSVVVDAPVQMAREVASLQQSRGALTPRDLEPLLGAVAAALPESAQVLALDFAPGELRLQGLQLQAPQVSELNARLAPQAYRATVVGDTLTVRQKGQP